MGRPSRYVNPLWLQSRCVHPQINHNVLHLQVTVLLPGGQNMNAANLHVLSNVAEAPQAILEPVSQVRTWRFVQKWHRT